MPEITENRPVNRLLRIATRACAVLSVLAAAACQTAGSSGDARSQSGGLVDPGQPVQVALLVPGGTGNNNIEYLARSLKNAAKMAAADAQGATIDLRVYETGGDAARAVAQANAAADDGAQIILGPLFAESANAVGNAMQPRDINVLSFSNNPDIAGGNVFALGTNFLNVADRLVSYGVKNGKRNIYIVAEDDVSGQIGARAIETAIARNGARLAGRTDHPVSVSGIDAVTPQIVEAAQSGAVDAIFMTANQQAVLPYVTQTLAAAGITPPGTQFMGLTRWDEPTARLSMPQLQNGWFAIPDQRLQQQFSNRYQSAYGEPPHELASLAYDGVSAIASQLRAGKRDALTVSGLTQPSGFAGVGGVFRLLDDRTAERGLAVATIRNQQVVILDSVPGSFGGFGF